MQVTKLRLQIAVLIAVAFSATGCHKTQAVKVPVPAPTAAPAVIAQDTDHSSAAEAAGSAQAAESVVPETDAVPELIAGAEKEHQAGLENFKAGRLEAAKQNYTHALDMIAKGPIDVKADPRLQGEFDSIMNSLKSLNVQDQEQAEASTEKDSEPAPIDEANEETPEVDPNVKAKAEEEVKVTHSDLPLMMTDPVAAYINYFSGRGRDILERGLIRSGRYQEMIQSILKEAGVPQDLIYLAQAESGFHPLALSRVGARGMWQFMASRGAGYGLKRTTWVDDRQDPEKATRAAAQHLKDLYYQFGDWYLAMAAYNSGPGGVQSAVKRTGFADFWELYKRNVLPRETRNYVPIILAVTIMAKNPAQYGLQDLVLDKPVPYETVTIDYPVDLRLAAAAIDVDASILQDLNPSLLRWSTPEDTEFKLRLPAGKKEQYLEAISRVPAEMRMWWRFHKVAPGDTLESIAQAYRTTPQAIGDANALTPESELPAETKLVIPMAPGKHAASEDTQTYARRITRYKVRHGDTVTRVAEHFSVPPSMVRRWNGLRGDSVRGRRILYVHLPVSPGSQDAWVDTAKPKSKSTLRASSSKSVTRHKVQKGETLTSIASHHNTTVQALKRDNGNLGILRPGMILIIRGSK